MATVLDRRPLEIAPGPAHVVMEDDARGWRAQVSAAREAARLRHAFRDYLEAYADRRSDVPAAESIFGELVVNCARHAPGPLHLAFRWSDSTLCVTDCCDRLRTWPYSPDDISAETTQLGYRIVNALSVRLVLARDPLGGTRATIVLPVLSAAPSGG